MGYISEGKAPYRGRQQLATESGGRKARKSREEANAHQGMFELQIIYWIFIYYDEEQTWISQLIYNNSEDIIHVFPLAVQIQENAEGSSTVNMN